MPNKSSPSPSHAHGLVGVTAYIELSAMLDAADDDYAPLAVQMRQ